jgi:hypothetical protein
LCTCLYEQFLFIIHSRDVKLLFGLETENMKIPGIYATVLISAVVLLSACGRNDPIPELRQVPETTLLHIHMEPGMNASLTTFARISFSGFVLADSLLKMGPLGISLVGVDISTLDPQLLLLTEDATPEYATALAARILDLDPKQQENRVDLVSEHGYVRASVTQRDGWTAVYVGPAPRIILGSWLELKRENSLAADTSLAAVIPANRHITMLFPGNLFGFVSLLPLERQIPWWTNYRNMADRVKPSALSISVSWPESEADKPVQAEIILARHDGGVASIEVSLHDTNINSDSIFVLVLDLLKGVSE